MGKKGVRCALLREINIMALGELKPENLFDGGGSTQYWLVKPFLDNVVHFYRHYPTADSFLSYLSIQLETALSVCEEREELPDWVLDPIDYQRKSEILISVTMFQQVFDEIESQDEKDRSSLIAGIYKELKKIGKSRGWDMKVLHHQVIQVIEQKKFEFFESLFDSSDGNVLEESSEKNTAIDYN